MRIHLLIVALCVFHVAIARADDLVASESSADQAMLVERVGKDTLDTIYQEPLADVGKLGASEWAWTDPKTLWVLRRDHDRHLGDTRLTVAKIVDGKAEPERELQLADFKLAREPVPVAHGGVELAHLIVTNKGEVWVQKCIKYLEGGYPYCNFGYLRVDRPAALAFKPPAASDIVHDGDGLKHQPELAAIATPPGYAAAIKTAKVDSFKFVGLECKGPDGTFHYPQIPMGLDPQLAEQVPGAVLAEAASEQVVKVEWVSASPALLRFWVKASRPPTGVLAMYVASCNDLEPAAQVLHDGRWLEVTDRAPAQAIVRRADGSEVRRLRGGVHPVVAH